MNDLATIVLISLMPGVGNFAGALIAEAVQTSPRRLNWALHAASGIVIAIVAVELLPRAAQAVSGGWLASAFGAGGLGYILLRAAVHKAQDTSGRRNRTGMWMVYVAVAIDLVSDGLVLGTGTAVNVGLGLTLAAGQVLADLPEGYAAMSNFRQQGLPRGRRLWLAASFVAFCTLAAVAAFLLLRDLSQPVKLAGLVVVAGMLTLAAVEDILEEAHESQEDTMASSLAFLAGFVLFTLVSAGLEGVVGAP